MPPTTFDLCELFARSVRRTPNQLAVDHESGTLTYAELDVASSHLAQRLQQDGVVPGDIVLLLTEHGTRNIVALLAILKAKACYVPLDRSSWSSERIQAVLDSVDSRFLINTTIEPFESPRHKVIHLQTVDVASNSYSSTEITPDDLACLIFTSGSTGKPKGVMIPHRAVANYAQTSPFNMDVQSGDRVLHILSVAFDASTGMLFSILGNSGTVVPATMDSLFDKAQTCTILASTPSILATLPLPSALPNSYPSVHTILLGGESPPAALLADWLARGVRILNAYGPTETTVASLMQDVEVSQATGKINRSIIGIPMPNGPAYLLRPDLTPVTDDEEEGEIVIAGIGLAHGYYQNAALTAERFIDWRGTRVYRTGDQGRWTYRNDGQRVIEFRGRSDRTVKNRGFLVNLPADVEEPLRMMGYGVTDVYAAMVNGLLIVLVTPATVDLDGLRTEAQRRLSSFHVPGRYCAVDHFPLSANGKIDTKAIENLLEDNQARLLETSEDLSQIPCEGDAKPPALDQVVTECLYTALGLDPLSSFTQKDINFFAMGGNSLNALRFTSLCREKGIFITTRDLYLHPTVREIIQCAHTTPDPFGPPSQGKELIGQLPTLRAEVAAHLQAGDFLPADTHVAPLTPLQLELSAPILESDGTNTNQVHLSYPLAMADRICNAWRQLCLNEPVFRTQIALEIGPGVQIVHSRPLYRPTEMIYHRRADYDAALTDPSRLSVGLGMRLDFSKFVPSDDDAGEVTVTWTVHHALIDGYSLGLILAQVQQAVCGAPLMTSSSFLDPAWRLLSIQEQRDSEARRFWAQYLEPVRSLATNGQTTAMSPITQPYLAQEVLFSHAGGVDQLQQLAASCKVTLATIYYTAWAMVVAKSTNNTLVTLGAVFSGRETLPEYEAAVGPLMAILPLVCRLEADASVEQQLQNTLQGLATISSYAWSAPDQVGYRVQSLLATQYDFPAYDQAVTPRKERFFENTTFPLSLLIEADAHFRLVYNPAVHCAKTVQRSAEMFQGALNALVQGATMGSWLDSSETGGPVLPGGISPDDDGQVNVASAFRDSVEHHANLAALEGPGGSLSYRELDRRSNSVAHYISQQVPHARVIAIRADGTLNWVVGILGILKAGCAYCPLDPAYPMARQVAVYERSGADALLLPSPVPASATLDLPDLRVLRVDDAGDNTHWQPSLLANANEDALIVFTSGTTGRPKGVPISHKGLLALQSNPEATMFSAPGRRIAQFMSPAFDYCANEIFSALLHGGTLVLRDPSDPLSHLTKVDVSTITPSVLSVLDPADYPNLSMVYATGEPVTPGLLERWADGREFYNAYGPAECSICTSFTRLVPGQQVTIGRAICTARMYILDPESLQPVSDGQTGEIFLAGQQVMRGYIGDEETTAYRVLSDPWHPGERMYRTGDYGYWSEDREIIYIGRLDRQVKIRGVRVELAAVEQKMYQEEPQLTQAAALVVNDTLVAFVMPDTVDVRRLEQRLRDSLQPTWVPQVITALAEFPWTANRKVDSRKLEEMATLVRREDGPKKTPVIVREDPIAAGVENIWRKVLRLDSGAALHGTDDFRSLGGHSILQMMLAARLGSTFGVTISIRDIFEHPTLSEQTELVRCRRQKKNSASQRKAPCEALPDHCLSALERQTWFQYLVASDIRTFNIPVLLHLEGTLDRDRLIRSLNAVLASRKVFRTNFVETPLGPCRIFRDTAPQVRVCDDALDTAREIDRGFDLSRDELIRVFVHRRTLLVVTSHAVADLNSVQNLLRETSAVYAGSTPMAERWHYLRAPAWSRQATEEERQFWPQYLQGAPQRLHIPRRPGQVTFEGTSRLIHFQGSLVERLNGLSREYGMSQHQMVCAAVAQTLQWLAGSNDVVLGSPWANRVLDLEQESMGLFLDRLPLRIQTPADADCATILKSTREASQRAVSYAIPFEQILHLLHLPRTIQQHPIFEAMVTFHMKGAVEECLAIDGLEVKREMCFASGAKFLLMFEWTELDTDHWVLRIEYDHHQIDSATISTVDQGLRCVMEGLADQIPRSAIHGRLNEMAKAVVTSPTATTGVNSTLYKRLLGILRREMATCLGLRLDDLPSSVSFFEAGADSLHAWRLRRQLKRVGLDVPIYTIFDHPTAQSLAQYLGRRAF